MIFALFEQTQYPIDQRPWIYLVGRPSAGERRFAASPSPVGSERFPQDGHAIDVHVRGPGEHQERPLILTDQNGHRAPYGDQFVRPFHH